VIVLDKKNWTLNEHQFLVTLNKSANKTLNLLHKTCGEASLRAHVFQWHKRFSKGTENLEDE
jgi:hypothetical protein